MQSHPRINPSKGGVLCREFRVCGRGDGVSGSDLSHHTQFHRLVTNAVITGEWQRVIVLVKEDFDRDSGGIGLAFGSVGAAVGAERALADREVYGFADYREFDWCHASLLVPDVICLSSSNHSLRLNSKFDANFWRYFALALQGDCCINPKQRSLGDTHHISLKHKRKGNILTCQGFTPLAGICRPSGAQIGVVPVILGLTPQVKVRDNRNFAAARHGVDQRAKPGAATEKSYFANCSGWRLWKPVAS